MLLFITLQNIVWRVNNGYKESQNPIKSNDIEITFLTVATTSMLEISFDSKGYSVKKFYVVSPRFGLLNLASS